MDTNTSRATPNFTVNVPDMELWEPPFDRWLRLADALLATNAVPAVRSASRPNKS